MHIVGELGDDQPKHVFQLGSGTSSNYYTDLVWENKDDAKQWFENKGTEIKCALVLSRRSENDCLDFFLREK